MTRLSAVTRVHATAIAVGGRAALIRGPSGAGKSDLALRCIAQAPTALTPTAARLVSDDQVELRSTEAGALAVNAPAVLSGQLEVRGIGIIDVPTDPGPVRLALVVDIVPPRTAIARMPEPATVAVEGIRVPHMELDAFEPCAPLKVLLALSRSNIDATPPTAVARPGTEDT